MTFDAARFRTIIGLSAPTAVALLVHNLMMLASTAMIGALRVEALAGVGVSVAIYLIFNAVLFGLDTGVQTLVARRAGEGHSDEAFGILIDALALSTLAGVILFLGADLGGPVVLRHVLRDPAAVREGVRYLTTVAPTLLFIGANYAFGAFWNGLRRPKVAFLVILCQAPFSVAASYILTFGVAGAPRMGVSGAGLGLVLGEAVALLLNLELARRRAAQHKEHARPPSRRGMMALVRLGAPISGQQSLLQVGTTVYYAILAAIGAREVAIANVLIGVDHLSILPAVGVGIAAATLVGWSIGAGRRTDAGRWGWEAAAFGAAATAPLAAVLLIFPTTVLGLFLHDRVTLEAAVTPTRLMGLTMCSDSFGRILGFALRGSGATRTVATLNAVIQWFVLLPAVWLIGVRLGCGLTGVAACRFVVYSLEACAIAWIWRRGGWSSHPADLPATIPIAEMTAA